MNCDKCETPLDQYEWCPTLGCVNARQPMSDAGYDLFMFAATQSALRLCEQGIDLRPEVEEGKAAA